jgi:VRR-NUC domain
MRLPAIVPEAFLRALPPEERRRLGRAGFTREECERRFLAGEERKLKGYVVNFLNSRGAWIFHQSMSKKTGGRPGVPDILCCYRGRFIAIELKVRGSKLSPEQEREAERLRNSGGVFVVVRRLEDLVEALRGADVREISRR